jgi:hypothetical protein
MTSRIVWGAALALGLAVLAPAAAQADEPVDLAGAYVLDNSDVLSTAEESRVEESLDRLYADTGMQLFVVYVDSFDGAASAEEWGDDSAVLSGLGDKDALLSIATEDRQYSVSVAEAFPLGTDDLADIEQNALIPQLRDDQWADAGVAFADGLRGEGNSSGSLPLWPIVLILVAAVGSVVVFVLVRAARRRANGETGLAPGEPSQQQLDQRAGTLLVELDDSLQTSEQELGFAVAQFGDDATRPFAEALGSARTSMAEAFGIRQRLDDAFPETAEERRRLTLRVIELAEQADAALDAQADAFDALREVEKNAPAILDTVDAQAAALRTRLAAAETATAALAARYSPTAIATVVDNAAQARTLLELAGTTAAKARADLAGASGSAAVGVRAAQAGVAQAGQLLDAVDAATRSLAEAQTALDAAVEELNRDLAEARAVPGGELAAAVDAASSGLAAVLPGSERDPLDAVQRVQRLDAALDQSLGALRDRQANEAKARASLERVLGAARAQLASGEQFLATRRGAVDTGARTRLASARQALDEADALAATDPAAALSSATRAATLAQQGTELARGDVDYFSRSTGYSPGGSGGGYGGSDLTGDILGGILGGLLSGGGGGGGGYRSSGRSSSRSYGGSSRRSGGSSRSSGSRGGRRGGSGRF